MMRRYVASGALNRRNDATIISHGSMLAHHALTPQRRALTLRPAWVQGPATFTHATAVDADWSE